MLPQLKVIVLSAFQTKEKTSKKLIINNFNWSIVGNDELADLLIIKYGANVNLQSSDGQTALHVAANNGNLKFGHVLINNGAAVDAFDQNHVTPLQLAVFNGNALNPKLINLTIEE